VAREGFLRQGSESDGERLVRVGRFAYDQEPEIRQLAALVGEGETVLDVGANGGQYTYTLARLVGRAGRVICVEPLPELAEYLRQAAGELDLPIEVVACAASDRDGSAELHIPLEDGRRLLAQGSLIAHGADQFVTIDVPLRRLDDIAAGAPSRISFVKIDVEGHELGVLRGATATLARHRPVLLVEIERRHSPAPIDETFRFLADLGYAGSFLDDRGGSQPLSAFAPDVHHTPRHDILALPQCW
jgi:FkbM family methyltransferase